MALETLEKQFEQKLENHSSDQLSQFAWQFAIRALPFLGSYGNFNYWKKKDIQKHLYAIFYALDFTAIDVPINADKNATIEISSVTYEAFRAADTYSKAAYAFGYADDDAVCAADAAAAAAEAVYAASFAQAAAAASAAATAATAAASLLKNGIDLESIILQEIQKIHNSENWDVNLSVAYGSVWTNFQNALDAEGCSYWGRLYQNIFDNGFVLDKKAHERRMSVPPEIREKGAAKVANYLEALEEQGDERLNEARIIILGDKGAGKTCLSRRLVDTNSPMTTDKESTPGVDTSIWKLKEENINVHIWDFAGHTVTHAVHQLFLSERCLYVIVYDGRTEERNRLEYWLNHIKNYGGDSKAIILVNKRDQHSVNIPINSLKEQYPIQGVYTFSILDDKERLKDFRKEVAALIQNNPSWNKLKIPAKYYQVKEALEKLFINGNKGNSKEHITRSEFDRIAKSKGIADDKIEELLTDLHDLGVSLRYKDMGAFDTLVLNPEWISHGVYKIINWANEGKKHALTICDFAAVFQEDIKRYPEDKFKFLFGLMKRYELAYETKEGSTLIIPHLLNEDQPAKMPDFPVGESLMLRYKAEQPLPPNTISRFIIRHNDQIKKEETCYLVWRSGVVLEDTYGSIALVREDDRTISVSVKGLDKTNYISTLRETLNDIFNSYKSKKPELQYRIERFGEIPIEVAVKSPLWLPDRKILTHAIDNIPYYDENTRQQMFLNPTVNIYNITAQTLMSGNGSQFFDNSIHNTFNFHDCNIDLQGSLNDLARKLTKSGNSEEAEELKDAIELLEEAENYKTKEEVKKKGIARSLQNLAKKLGDEDSKLHKTVEGIKNGIGIAQDIAKGYNDIAQWMGLPQVPKPFLKKE